MESTLDSNSPSPDEQQSSSQLVAVRHFKPLRKLEALLVHFSPFERLSLYVLTVVMAVSALAIVIDLNSAVSTEVPTRGGTLVEGAVGTPRFVNPLLAVTQPDQDLSALVYSGLLRATPDGGFIEDLAQSYEVSEDGTTYTFHLRPDATFHDDTPVTAHDVLFTITRAQNPETKSPRRADWEGVGVSAPDDRTVVFTLPNAYAPFLENATMGILPAHLWEGVPASEFQFTQLNTNPIGSGPYRIKDLLTDATGAPTEYTLTPFNNFALGAPNLTRLIYRVYPNENALTSAFEHGDIDSFIAASPKTLPELGNDVREIRIPLTRVFGIFLNQSHAPILADAAVRSALSTAIDKRGIVEEILGGYGSPLDGPVPPGLLADEAPVAQDERSDEERVRAARDALAAGGWKWNESGSAWEKGNVQLSITLSTADVEELVQTANAIAEQWRSAGIRTSVQVYPITELNQTILRPRNYDAILFGEIVGRSLDLFAFWHSSQRNDPGLNLSLYTNAKADKLLADARAEENRRTRESYFAKFLEYIAKDKPAVFLYAPELAYIVPSYLNGVDIGALTTPAERFASVYLWYRDTERVWNIFAKRPLETINQ